MLIYYIFKCVNNNKICKQINFENIDNNNFFFKLKFT